MTLIGRFWVTPEGAVGPEAIEREDIVGFPIMKIHLFGESLRVEIVAFTLTERQWEPQQDPLAAIS